MAQKAKDKNEVLGYLVNFLGNSTETADTRSWLSLPSHVRIARFSLPPGTVDLVLEFLDRGVQVVDSRCFPEVEVKTDKAVFLSCRSYR